MTEYIKRKWRNAPGVTKGVFLIGIMLLLCAVVWVFATDTDSDGMSDQYEQFFGLNYTNAADAALNYDDDTLVNSNEFPIWTDPFETDTDLDGFNDGDDSNAVSRAYIDWGNAFFTTTNDYVNYTYPDWLLNAFMDEGTWQTNVPTAWYVPSSSNDDFGILKIDIDRSILTNDVVIGIGILDSTNGTLYVDLYDTNDEVIVSNLYGNIYQGGTQELDVVTNVALETYTEAVGIRIRRGTGEITVYDCLLYVDKDMDGLDKEQEDQLGTSDIYTDSDYDGLSDYAEVFTYGTDPADGDSDDDGLGDGTEVNTYGTDPLNPPCTG